MFEFQSSQRRLAISQGEPLHNPEQLPKTLTVALRQATQSSPDQGIIYIQSDDSEIFQSYPNLLEDAQRILAGLRQLGLQPQDKVIFQLPDNQHFISTFWGCVLGGFIPVTLEVIPADQDAHSAVKKLRNVWRMLDQPLIVASQSLAPAIESCFDSDAFSPVQLKTFETLAAHEPDTRWHEGGPDDLALLLFTSGSTGTPKGVMLSHRLMLYRAAISAQRHQMNRESVSINWLPLDHVSGIAQFHIRDIYLGCRQVHAPTDAFLQDPLKWLDWIECFGANITWAPNFAYGLVNDQANRILDRQWDLGSLQIFLNAGEAIAPQTARRFMELLTPHGLSATAMNPAWGMSETAGAVVYSDRYSLATADAQFVETGSPGPDLSIRIVDAQNQVVAEDVIGALQIKGPMVTSGYYQNPEANQAAFTDDSWFNTGDLGFIRDGRLTITGRKKDVIIINGLNYYCHEIEAMVEEIEGVAVSYTAACGVRTLNRDTDQLAIFFHPTNTNESELLALLTQIRGSVAKNSGVNPTYLIPVEPCLIPKTGIGKIQRSQLKQRFEAGEFAAILKRIDRLSGNANHLSLSNQSQSETLSDDLTEQIAEIWRAVFGIPDIGRQDNFFELGGHSILATQLIGRLSKEFELELSLQVLLSAPTVAELAEVIAAARGQHTLSSEIDLPQIENPLVDLNAPFPLNDIQQAYWLGRDPSFELGNISTHAYGEMDCFGVDLERLKWVVQSLIDYHPMLRAVILPDGQQHILADVPPYELKVTDLSKLEPSLQAQQLQATRDQLSHQVFATDQWPLFEIRAAILGGGKTRLYLSLDLLIADASTLQTLRQQLLYLYFHPQPELPPMGVSFRDYVLAERALETREEYQKAKRYWFDRVDSLPPAPDLPLAVYPSQIDKPRFKRRRYRLEPKLWQALKKRGQHAGITSSGILLTAFSDVLTLWNRRTHFTLNLTTFNRLPIHPQINDLVGDFTYLTLLEVDFRQQLPFEARAQQLQQQLFKDLDHRQCSGVQVLRELNRRHGGETKISMPVIFTSFLGLPQKEDLGVNKTIDQIGEVVYAISQTSQAWIDHVVFEEHGAMVCCWDVVDALFPDGFMDDLFAAYCHWLERLATDESAWRKSERAHLLPEHQRQQRAEANATEVPITDDLLHSLFVQQVPQRPRQPAVITPERSLSYEELYQLAHQLAHQLHRQGAKPNQMVAVILEKGWRQVVAVLGVFLAGVAYVPIDPKFPVQRQQQVLRQSQARLVVSTQDWLESNSNSSYEVLVLDDVLAQAPETLPPLTCVQQPEDLAYVIYTSGSTGKPKGVAIDHRGALNTLLDLNRRFNVTPDDRVFALAGLTFDLSVYDIFGLLAAGGAMVMPAADKVKEPAHWVDLMQQHRVTILNAVPTQAQMLVEYLSAERMIIPDGLRLAMLSADVPPVSLPSQLRRLWPELDISNVGGATEASIWSITYPIEEIDPEWISIPYGKPMDNQFAAILNEQLDPCPVWVSGDLYIGGVGLAQGYWQDPEKTAAGFIQHPLTGERLYRTGDKGRYLPDGNLEFLGREDNQVKLRGFRIELGEIESVFDRYPTIKQTLVTTVGEGSDKQLAAYIVCHTESAGNVSEAQDPFELAGVIKDPIERTEFKLAQPGLHPIEAHQRSVSLPKPVVDADLKQKYLDRQSHRQFSADAVSQETLERVLSSLTALSIDTTPAQIATQSPLALETLSYVLSAVMGIPIEGAALPKYRYPSAGNLYPVQLYVRVGEGAIANLEPGIYYYHRVDHCLVQQGALSGDPNDSGITFYLVGQLSAIDPMYGELATDFCLLEAGYMSEVLRIAGSEQQVYLQPQTNSPTDLELDDQQLLLQQFTLTPQATASWVENSQALEVYLYLKPELESDLPSGMYRYRPSHQTLEPISFLGDIEGAVYGGNQNIFEAGGLSLFLVEANPSPNQSLQNEVLLMAGRWGQALMTASPQHQIGWCPLGRIEETRLRAELGLNPQQRILHSFVGGAIAIAHPQQWLAFEAQQSELTLEEELLQHASLYLPDYMVPTYVVPLEKIPVSPNGKVDRKSLPSPNLKSKEEGVFVAPQTPTQETIAKLVEKALKIEQIGLYDNLFEHGMDSLVATQLVVRLRDTFAVEVSLRVMLSSPSVEGLATVIETSLAESNSVLKSRPDLPQIESAPADLNEPFSLNDIQQAYWLGRDPSFELGNVATHGYFEIDCPGLDLARLNQAVQRLIDHHPMLQAVILPDGQQQILAETPSYKLAIADVSTLDPSKQSQQLAAIRDELSHQVLPTHQWPLFELRATILGEGKTRLHLSLDSLIADVASLQRLGQQLLHLYYHPEAELSTLNLSFRDYVLAEQALQTSEWYQQAERYWFNRLDTLPAAPELPLAIHASQIDQPRFKRFSYRLAPEHWQALQKQGKQVGLTPSGLLLTAFSDILSVWSRRAHFTLNLTTFNRFPLHPQVNEIVGDFTSLTLLEVDFREHLSFQERARKLQQQLFEDLDYRQCSAIRVLRERARRFGNEGQAAMPVVFTSTLGLNPVKESGLTSDVRQLGEVVYSISQTPQVWLDHVVFEDQGALLFNWDVVEALFPNGMLDAMFSAYCDWLEQLATDNSTWGQVRREHLLPEEQRWRRAQINATEAPVSEHLLQGLFTDQVLQRAQQPAVITPERCLSYEELAQLSLQLAQQLRQQGAQPNTLVAVELEKGWRQVVAVLGVLMSGAAYVPIDPKFPPQRQQQRLAQSKVQWVVATQTWLESLEASGAYQVLVLDDVLAQSQENPLPLEWVQQPDDLAYIIYTSGSTGTPKGVATDHRGAVNTVLDINRRFAVGPEDRVLALSALNFDLSVYDIFGVLAAGGAIVMPDAEKVKEPAHWVELMQQHQVTLWDTVPALAQMLTDYLSGGGITVPVGLRLALLSGDWLPLSLPDQLRQFWPEMAVISLGGATEASIWSIAYPISAVDPNWTSIPYGKPLANQSFAVLNHQLEPCPVWAPGDLYIGGIGLAQGYWQDEARTAASFIRHPASGERLYRTGDLGRYLPDGNIEFLGREDSQVKIRGFRIELGEIESALNQHPTVKQAVVTTVGPRFNQQLAAYVIPTFETPMTAMAMAEELRQFVLSRLPDYMVPMFFVPLERLPLTPNGKVNLKALPEPDQAATQSAPFALPSTAVEHQLAQIWADILKQDQLSVHDNFFFELGGDSLLATQVISRLRDVLSVDLPLSRLFEFPTIAQLAQRVEETGEVASALPPSIPIQSVPREGYFPLTFEQERLWFFTQLEPNNSSLNISLAYRLKGALNVAALEQSLCEIVRRHASLRTAFLVIDGHPRQVIASDISLTLPLVELQNLSPDQQQEAVQHLVAEMDEHPLDLTQAPLLRTKLLRLAAEEHILLSTTHLIICDGWSTNIFRQELTTLYGAFSQGQSSPLPKLPIQYGDFAVWQHQRLQDGVMQSQIGYWQQQLEGSLTALDLPTDRSRPLVKTYPGACYSSRLPDDLAESLKALSQKEEVTLFMTLLAVFQALLHIYSGQDDIIVGSPIAGRDRLETEELIGLFAKPVLFRTSLEGDPSFQDLLVREREVVLAAYRHQDVPLNKLVEALKPIRDPSRTPFSEVSFVLQNISTQYPVLPDLAIEDDIRDHHSDSAKNDITLFMKETSAGLKAWWEYNTDLFDAATIIRMSQHFQVLLEAIVANPDQPLSDLSRLIRPSISLSSSAYAPSSSDSKELPADEANLKTTDEFISHLRHLGVKLWLEDDHLRYKAPKDSLTSALIAQLRERKTEILIFLRQADQILRS